MNEPSLVNVHAGANANPTLTPRLYWSLSAAYGLSSIQFWMTVPLAAVALAERGIPAWKIGLIGAVPWLALVALLPWVPRMVATFGPARVFGAGAILGAFGAFGFALGHSITAWVLAYAACGGGMALRWIVADGTIAALAPANRRGHLVGMFETMAGGTIAIGPAILTITGTADTWAFWIGVALALAALPPLLGVKVPKTLFAPRPGDGHARHSPLAVARHMMWAPMAAAMAMGAGVIDGSGAKLFPVQAVEMGWPDTWAAATTTAFGAGNILTQYVTGRLCDHVASHKVALAALVVLGVAGLAMGLNGASDTGIHFALLVIIGGAAGALYTIAVIRAGASGDPLDALGIVAGIGVVYTGGSVIGPAVGGALLSLSPAWGLGSVVTVTAAVAAWITWRSTSHPVATAERLS